MRSAMCEIKQSPKQISMKWKKTPPELIEFLDKTMLPFACSRRPMFGSIAYFVNHNMFIGALGDNIILRLSEKDRKEILTTHDEVAPFEPMPGRVMKEYVSLPESIYGNIEHFRKWLNRSYRYAESLKPKVPKQRKSRSEHDLS
jgi:TfoX/Sxy family transcriptional regulator of competence genes